MTMKTTGLWASAAVIALTGAAQADQVFADDVIVDGSLCVGFDCATGESFGFDTIRLKENNVRIKFDDTSGSASFPSNDWQLTANDSSNGGAEKFSLDDITNNKTPMTIEANAPSNMLFVASEGRIGVRNSNPVLDLHVTQGNSPALRLEQDGSSGFASQTWDISGNETNFFIRDVTNSSLLPFRIKPGASKNSIFIEATGDVGMKSETPDARLHILGDEVRSQPILYVSTSDAAAGAGSSTSALHINTGTGNAEIALEQAGTMGETWVFKNNQSTGRLTVGNSASTPFKIDPRSQTNLLTMGLNDASVIDVDGNIDVTGDIDVAGTITTSGSCSAGCDAVFEAEYDLKTIDAHQEMMWAKGHLPNVGPTFEGQRFDLNDKLGRMLNELEHAHIYIGQLNARITDLEAQLARD